jgi:hypothetical protein
VGREDVALGGHATDKVEVGAIGGDGHCDCCWRRT